MDIAYGTGNWTVENIRLAFQFTLYANNSRFGGGAGDFDVYWVANDGWVQGSNNPVHATEATGLLSWSGDQEMLVRKYYSWSTATYAGTVADLTSWTTDKTGERQGVLTVELGTAGKLVSDMVAPVEPQCCPLFRSMWSPFRSRPRQFCWGWRSLGGSPGKTDAHEKTRGFFPARAARRSRGGGTSCLAWNRGGWTEY